MIGNKNDPSIFSTRNLAVASLFGVVGAGMGFIQGMNVEHVDYFFKGAGDLAVPLIDSVVTGLMTGGTTLVTRHLLRNSYHPLEKIFVGATFINAGLFGSAALTTGTLDYICNKNYQEKTGEKKRTAERREPVQMLAFKKDMAHVAGVCPVGLSADGKTCVMPVMALNPC